MKNLITSLCIVSLFMCSCSTTKKEQRLEAKRKREAARMEQLEKDKRQFEQKNRDDLGK
jgi:hypothetical protein